MDHYCYALQGNTIAQLQNTDTKVATEKLENGHILYLPSFTFPMISEDNTLLTDTILDGSHKNVSFDYRNNKSKGVTDNTSICKKHLTEFMKRYAEFSKTLVDTLLPAYRNHLQWGRTSYRPAEIKGRTTSKRKDDTRLHVDSFSASPVNGLRILRVFCNINPYGEPRVWNIGEPFEKVLAQFAPSIPRYNAFWAKILQLLKTTKTLRSAYDHYMLQLHDRMKLDDNYQRSVHKNQMDFPPLSTWIVFTDHVSHAALSGQYLLEQTFYLPVEAMDDPGLSPMKQWEQYLSLGEHLTLST